MSSQLPPGRTLDSLKKEAKRWLKALRANVDDARARLERALPNAPRIPGLRDIQHALALEHGFPGWSALKEKLAGASDERAAIDPVDWFLENACPDHHVRGGPSHVTALHTAMRILDRYPAIASDNVYTRVVVGDLTGVEHALAGDAVLATGKRTAVGPDRTKPRDDDGNLRENLGPKRWEPLLFLAFTRLSLQQTNDNAVAVARALLDRGADPNVFFMAGDSRYTPLVGVIGEGEEDRPPHPERDALVRLLLDRGAEPYDIQVVYNIHFHGKILWFLKVIHEHSVKLGRAKDWDDPEWSMLSMHNYGTGARWHLDVAIDQNDMELAEWVLSHGANPNAGPARAKTFSQVSLYERAVREGLTEMADLLVRYGAMAVEVKLDGVERLTAAALRLDADAARGLVAEHPEYLRDTAPIFAAMQDDRVDVARLLLDLGVSPNVEDRDKHRPLHMAAYADALHVAELLIERGAEIDPVASAYNNTPLGAANYTQHPRMVELIGRHSRDVWELTWTGNVIRLRELFREKPELARIASGGGHTPMMWLPTFSEDRAIEIAELFITNGANAALEDDDRRTAADRAERVGMFRAAAVLRAAASPVARQRLERYEEAAEALLDAYRTGTPEAMERHWKQTWHRRAWQAMRTYVQLDLGKPPASEGENVDISLDDARFLVAREHGFDSWSALVAHVVSLPTTPTAIAAKPVAPFFPGEPDDDRRKRSTRDWDAAITLMRERRIPALDAHEQMTDEMLERVAELGHVTTLKLNGSKQLTDTGLLHLARMPQLQHLDVTGTAITDAGLAVLRQLPELRTFSAAMTRITDVGAAALAQCPHLERVDLGGTRTGDGAIRALAGKDHLSHLCTGNGVTDAGLALLHRVPVFKSWHGGDVSMSLTSYDAAPNYLMLRGPFTDQGLAQLAGLDGLFALNIDAAELLITPPGLEPLIGLPHLEWLAVDANDESMKYVGAMPHLRFLGCQDTVAGDDGFVALSRSRTIEHIWGRRCHNLRDRGFVALSTMPALRALSVSCKNVGDDALASLPGFPALWELMPMDVPDAGYRHIARCEKLESLVLMYCRDTTDAATEHIAYMSTLKKYFASYTQITDRTPELLGGISSLQRIGLTGCIGLTNSGISALVRLPNLEDLSLDGLRNVTPDVATLFPPHVRVHYSL